MQKNIDTNNDIEVTQEKIIVVEQSIYQCSYPNCTRIFRTKFALKRHSLIHTNERRFKCEKCERSFLLPQYLREHMNIHTQEKPYICGIGGCKETFRQAGKLSIHRRTHPEYVVKKYKYNLNPKKRRSSERESSSKQLIRKDSEQTSSNAIIKKDEQFKEEKPKITKKETNIFKHLPSITLFLALNSQSKEQINKAKLMTNSLQLLNSKIPPYSFPMMQCIPWLTLPCRTLFHPVLPFPNVMMCYNSTKEQITL